MRKEIWKSIEGYESLYECSNMGRIKRVEALIKQNHPIQKHRIIKERILIPNINKRGYERIMLSNKRHKIFSVHQLVAKAFVSNPLNKKAVNHKDGIKNNNNSTNLEWVTGSENMFHAHKIGLINYDKKRISI